MNAIIITVEKDYALKQGNTGHYKMWFLGKLR